MRILITSFLLMLAASMAAQTKIQISGFVKDAEDGSPVAGSFVVIEGTPYACNSDENGYYEILIPSDMDSLRISCNKTNYTTEKSIRPISTKERKSGRLNFNFKLHFESYLLPEIRVDDKPDSVWGDPQLNVADFAFVGKNLLLLTYESEERWKKQEESKTTLLQGCRLILLDSTGQELMRSQVPEVSINFYVDYLNEVFLRCRKSTYHVTFDTENIRLEKISDQDFKRGIQPVIDTCGSLTCFSSFNADYPAFEYMIFNSLDSSYHTFRYMIDEKMMEMFRSEYKYLDPRGKLEAFRFEVNTGIDKEIIAAYMNGFQNTYYYEPLNSPLLTSNDTLVIFDHHHDKMIHFDWSGQALDSLLIHYHKTKRPERWGEKIMKDRITQKFYTSFNKQGSTYLREINKKTGDLGQGQKLAYRFLENIKVHGNFIYYVYRPFESSQNRYLYKEVIVSR